MSIRRWLVRHGLVRETPDDYMARINEYYSRPEVVERLRSLPATHVYNRTTGELTPIKPPTP